MNIAKNLSLLSVVWQHFITLTGALTIAIWNIFYSILNHKLDYQNYRKHCIHLIWTISEQKLFRKNTENHCKNHLGGPNFRRFSPTRTSDFRSFYRPKLAKLTKTTYTDLRSRGSWDAVHKTRGRLNHSKGRKQPIYYTPIRGSSSELTTLDKNQGQRY